MSKHSFECQGCSDREPGCHDRCEKYQKFKTEIEHDKKLKRDYQRKHGVEIFPYEQIITREKQDKE